MNKPVLITHQLRLTTETPVSIGGNQDHKLSPYVDYVFSHDGETVHYINQRALEAAVSATGLLDEYVRNISLGMENNRSDFDLRAFIIGRLQKELDDVTAFKTINRGIATDRKQEVAPIAKTAGRAYLPGSSLKGALRTAILYGWLIGSKEGEKVIAEYFSMLKDWEYLESEFHRLKRDFSQHAKSEKRELNKKMKALERRLFNEEALFGTIKDDVGQDSRRIRLTDTNVVGLWEVFGVQRIRLRPEGRQNPKGRGSTIPTPREAIPEEFSLDCRLTIEPPLRHPALQYLASEDTGELLKKLSYFSQDAISFEITELEEARYREHQDAIDGLLNFYRRLKTRSEKGEVFLRLGAGKTIYDNSLALALYNGGDPEPSMDAFDRFRNVMWRVRYADRIYPVTRTLTAEGLPLGWVKVEVT
ncbi:MAG: type III-A CRISPR-associated RAMP protein Csm5 [Bacteroidota bacterium]